MTMTFLNSGLLSLFFFERVSHGCRSKTFLNVLFVTSGHILKSEQGERFPLLSPPLPFPFFLPLPSLPLLLEVDPLNPARGSGGALYAPPAGSGAEP